VTRRLLLVVLAGCHAAAAAPQKPAAVAAAGDDEGEEVVSQPASAAASASAPARHGALAAVPASALCVTHGKLTVGARAVIREPSVRAVAQGTAGDVGEVHFAYHGVTAKTSKLKSGAEREQIALKLRAADGCNLVYVSWRFAPKPEVVVQTKINPGEHDGKACGNGGYTRVKPAKRSRVSVPDPDSEHVLGAMIDGTSLVALIDGAEVWRGLLPPGAASLHGPVGVRTDNVAADVDVYAIAGGEESGSKCEPGTGGD
jgi:hypothetical protein